MKKFVLLLSALLLPRLLVGETEESQDQHLLAQKIADSNMRVFQDEWEESWDNDDYEYYLRRSLNETLNPRLFKKRRITFQFLKTFEKKQRASGRDYQCDTTMWQDLDLFCGKGDKQKFVAQSLDRTQTELGKVCFYTMLAQPLTDISKLEQRQQIIRLFIEQEELKRRLDLYLSMLKDSENVMLTFWDRDSFRQGSKRHLFNFSLFKPLNDSQLALLAKSGFDHAKRAWDATYTGAIAAVLLSYGILHAATIIKVPTQLETWANENKSAGGSLLAPLWGIKNRWVHVGVALVAGIWCAASAQESLKWARACLLVEECIQTLMIHVAQFARGLEGLYTLVKENKQLAEFGECAPLIQFFETVVPQNEKLQELLELLKTETFEGEASLFSHKGAVLKAYVLLHEVKGQLEGAMASTGILDVYASLATLVKEHHDTKAGFCFPVYLRADHPSIDLTEFWHPFIDPEKVITNTIVLGAQERNNIILTGPNEGGKSTMLKTITLCLLLAQTAGIAPAQSLSFTPFTTLSTYLNITDDIGAGNSLFKAEVLRTQALVDEITQAQSDHYSFSVFDEMFNGTSPREGTAAAYSVAKHLGGFKNSMCLIATHFSLLTELEQKTGDFLNYKVSINRDDTGAITYPYKLERGISHQHVALDILRNQGFAGSIIDDARDVVSRVAY